MEIEILSCEGGNKLSSSFYHRINKMYCCYSASLKLLKEYSWIIGPAIFIFQIMFNVPVLCVSCHFPTNGMG